MHLRLKNSIILGIVTILSSVILWISVGMTTIYQNFDGPYYIVVAKTWYDKVSIGKNFSFPLPLEYYAAHFPAYPALINAISALGWNGLHSMLVATLLTSMAFVVCFYLILDTMRVKNAVWVAGASLFFWPRVWSVRSVGSPEMLFMLAIVISLWCFDKKRYFWAAVAGALAAATKSPGVLLAVAYLGYWISDFIKTRRINWKAWPIILIPLTLVAVFIFLQNQTGDFWAYFHSGDNIHLQAFPFQVFNSDQPWVGNWWLEDVVWVYLVSAIGVYYAFKKNKVWGWFGLVFWCVILFVSHRDISRYSLPLVPVVLLGLSELFERKEVRWILALSVIPMYFYSVNFLAHNIVAIGNWAPFL